MAVRLGSARRRTVHHRRACPENDPCSLCLASQNGSFGISGIFLQAKLMMMMMSELTATGAGFNSAQMI